MLPFLVFACIVAGPTAVTAETCAAFCVAQLGKASCPKGSYCKGHHDCHALFWRTPAQTTICVFTGDGACSTAHPVLCRDAELRMAISHSAAFTTALTSSRPITSTVTRVVAPVSVVELARRDYLSGTDEEVTQQLKAMGLLSDEETSSSGLGHFDSSQFSHIAVIPDVHGDAEYFIHSLWLAFQKIEATNLKPVPRAKLRKRFFDQIKAVADTVEFPSGHPRIRPLPPTLSMFGNKVALVQLGDIMDRGPQSLYSYKILASIETAIGWKVIQLAGNHDLMIYHPPLRTSREISRYPYLSSIRGVQTHCSSMPDWICTGPISF